MRDRYEGKEGKRGRERGKRRGQGERLGFRLCYVMSWCDVCEYVLRCVVLLAGGSGCSGVYIAMASAVQLQCMRSIFFLIISIQLTVRAQIGEHRS